MEVVVTNVRKWPEVAACGQMPAPMRNGSDPVKEGVRAVSAIKREWMGIEPTRRLCSRHTGFEAQDGHQIRVHSRCVTLKLRERHRELSYSTDTRHSISAATPELPGATIFSFEVRRDTTFA